MTDASIGYDTLLEVSTNGGADWTEVAEVFSITPPSETADAIDATHFQSPDRTREFIEGLVDPGECSFEMNFVPGSATDVLIRSLRGLGAVMWRMTFPNSVVWAFSGIRTGYEPAVPNDDKMTATVTIKVTGSTVSTPAAAPVNEVLPAISGTPEVGSELTAYPGVWSGAPSFTYQWKNEGVNIGGATAQTYTLQAGDTGDNITVTVTATNSEGSASATSAETIAIAAS
jgi:hypothetical protein